MEESPLDIASPDDTFEEVDHYLDGVARAEALAKKEAQRIRCIVALTDDDFDLLHPHIQLGQE